MRFVETMSRSLFLILIITGESLVQVCFLVEGMSRPLSKTYLGYDV